MICDLNEREDDLDHHLRNREVILMNALTLMDSKITCVAKCMKGKTEGLLQRGTRVRIIVSGLSEPVILDYVLLADSNVKVGCEVSSLEKISD